MGIYPEEAYLLESKMKSTHTILSALGDVSLSVCVDQGDSQFPIIRLLDAQFAFTRISSLFAVLQLYLESVAMAKTIWLNI